MTAYHLSPGASQGNAFTRHLDGGPSIFVTKQDLGHQARAAGRASAKGQANIRASNDRLNEIIQRQKVATADKRTTRRKA